MGAEMSGSILFHLFSAHAAFMYSVLKHVYALPIYQRLQKVVSP